MLKFQKAKALSSLHTFSNLGDHIGFHGFKYVDNFQI